jgi:hypothetical protein
VRFFCESMKAVFHGERNSGLIGSGLMGANLLTPPPDDDPFSTSGYTDDAYNQSDRMVTAARGGFTASAWLEIWDFAGGASFRAFVADNGTEKSLFVFFDTNVVGRDLKQA